MQAGTERSAEINESSWNGETRKLVELGGFTAGEGKMDIWKMEPYEPQFQLKSMYDVLPSMTFSSPSRATIK